MVRCWCDVVYCNPAQYIDYIDCLSPRLNPPGRLLAAAAGQKREGREQVFPACLPPPTTWLTHYDLLPLPASLTGDQTGIVGEERDDTRLAVCHVVVS